MDTPKIFIGLIFLSLILSGCFPTPVYEDDPYSDDVSNLKVGLTTKNDVIDLLGEPAATYAQELEFVFTDFQTESIALFVGIWEGVQHFLLLAFNEQGVLSDLRIESGERRSSGCIDSGWCASQEWAFRWADESKDIKAKQFIMAEGQCGIYMYGRIEPALTVSLDGKDMGSIFGKKYFQLWEIDPGFHEITVSLQSGVNAWGWNKHPSLSLNCAEGEVAFVEFNHFWSKSLKQEHDNKEGREQIEKRRLILSGPMRKVPDS